EQAKIFTAQALALFRQLDNARGIAGCLLSSALYHDTAAQKCAQALEAFHLFRQAGARDNAAQALQIALMNIENPADLIPLEADIRAALHDAQSTSNAAMQERCKEYLDQIATAQSNAPAATQ